MFFILLLDLFIFMLSHCKKARIPEGEIGGGGGTERWERGVGDSREGIVINWEVVYIQYIGKTAQHYSHYFIFCSRRQELPRFQKGQFPGN